MIARLKCRWWLSSLLSTVFVLFANASFADARIYFIAPKDGETVPPKFTVVLGVQGTELAPEGKKEKSARHAHLLIDVDSLENFSMPLPATSNIQHVDSAQSKHTLALPAGKHTLQLLITDYLHVPILPPVLSDKITIFVR